MAFRLGTALFFSLWAIAITLALVWNFAPDLRAYGFSTRSGDEISGQTGGSLGRDRHEVLAIATRKYLREGNSGTLEMKEGKGFAPPEFLNRELGRQGQKWRVRSIDGLNVDIFEVS